jgi:hypothetical protein
MAIKYYDSDGEYRASFVIGYELSDLPLSNLSELYYYRGLSKYKIGDKEGACLDWSEAGELIKEYCQ